MDIPTLLIGTAGGLFRIEAGKEHRDFPERAVSSLAVRDGIEWAILDKEQIWRNGGSGWERAAPSAGQKLNCILPSASGVLIGTSEAHLMRLRDGALELVEGFDAMEGRAEWFTPWGAPAATRSLAESPLGTLFANVHVGGVARSTDGGLSWEPTVEIGTDVHQVAAHPEDPNLVLAASAVGLGISTDGGREWTFRRAGLHATYQRAVAVAGDRVLVSSSQSERGKEAAVYRYTLGKRPHFEKCEEGLPRWFSDNVDTYCLIAAGDAAVVGDANGRIFASPDRGDTWSRLGGDFPPVRCLAFG